MRSVRSWVVAVVSVLLLTACHGPRLPDAAAPASRQVPDLRRGFVGAASWMPGDWVYFTYSASGTPSQLWRRPLDGSAAAQRVSFTPPAGSCNLGAITALQPLADGVLAVAASCDISDGYRGFVALLDVHTENARLLVSFPSFAGNAVAVLPDHTGAFVTAEAPDGLCQALAFFHTRQGLRPFTHLVTVGSSTFWPDGLFRAPADRPTCGSTGDAGWPAVTSDGSTLYFLARAAPSDRSDRMTTADGAIFRRRQPARPHPSKYGQVSAHRPASPRSR